VVPLLQRDPSRVYEEFAASAERDARAQLLELEARRLRPDPSTPEERRRVRDLLERLEAMSRIPPGTSPARLSPEHRVPIRNTLDLADFPRYRVWFDRLLGPEGQTAKDFDLN